MKTDVTRRLLVVWAAAMAACSENYHRGIGERSWAETSCVDVLEIGDSVGAVIEVVDYQRLPLPGAFVQMILDGADSAPEVTSDPDGRATFELAPGQYQVSVELIGFLPYFGKMRVQPASRCTLTAFLGLDRSH